MFQNAYRGLRTEGIYTFSIFFRDIQYSYLRTQNKF